MTSTPSPRTEPRRSDLIALAAHEGLSSPVGAAAALFILMAYAEDNLMCPAQANASPALSVADIAERCRGIERGPDADRAWLIELHNGSKNLGTGLPFLYGSMRMEEVRDSIFHVDDEYSDFNLSKYKLIVKTLRDGFFYGNLEDVRLVDERLYYKFKANNVNEIALIVLYDCKETPIGLLGLSYCNGKLMQRQLVGKEIRKGGLQIATQLSVKDGKD